MKECRAMMSILPVLVLPTIKSEEFFRSCGGCASDFFKRTVARARDFLRDESRIILQHVDDFGGVGPLEF